MDQYPARPAGEVSSDTSLTSDLIDDVFKRFEVARTNTILRHVFEECMEYVNGCIDARIDMSTVSLVVCAARHDPLACEQVWKTLLEPTECIIEARIIDVTDAHP
jgi:hypothetical protein